LAVRTGDFLTKDALATYLPQRRELEFKVLVGRGDASVPNFHSNSLIEISILAKYTAKRFTFAAYFCKSLGASNFVALVYIAKIRSLDVRTVR
jgi:hypothetical protein